MNIEKLIKNNREMDGIVIKLKGSPIIFLMHFGKMLDGIKFNDDDKFKDLRDDQFVHVKINFTKKNYYVDEHFGHYDYEITPISTYSIQGDGPKIDNMKVIEDGEFKNIVNSALNS